MIVEAVGPSEVKMGSIGGGGRYDDLAGSFGLNNVSGIGISFGFDRIYLVLEELNLFPSNINFKTEVLFLNLGINTSDFIFNKINELRFNGIICEFFTSEAKISRQLSYANKKGIKKVVIIGEEEIKNQKFSLKDMISREQNEYPLEDLKKILENVLKD